MNGELLGLLTTIITLSIGLWLVYWRWQQFSMDLTRQQLFELRDEVFDMATKGELVRESDAYRIVREMFNSSIRFVYKMNLLQIFVLTYVLKSAKLVEIEQYSEKVKLTINQVENEHTRQKLAQIIRQMQIVLAWHLYRTSPVLIIATMLAAVVALSIKTIQQSRDKFGNVVNGMAYSDAIRHC